MPSQFKITCSQAIEQVAAALTGPISLDEFYDRVLKLWPSTAKSAKNSIRNQIRFEQVGKTLLFVDKQTVIPTGVAIRGIAFRVSVDDQIAKTGLLPLYPTFSGLLSRWRRTDESDISFVDASGQPISTSMTTQQITYQSILGTDTGERTVFDLTGWSQQPQLKPGDSLLLTVEDWDNRQFRLVHEPAKVTQTHQQEIGQRNRELIEIMFDMLELAQHEMLWTIEAVLTAHIRLSNPTGYPGDHWLEALEQDGRMVWDGMNIRYADAWGDTLFDIFADDEAADSEAEAIELSEAEAQQVYRFKAALWHRPGLWRGIEIQGGQTLGDLHNILVNAFNHEWDHMGGFWKRIRRGNSKRFREVDLGSVDPFGEGDAADVLIAGLELEVGNELKYVFDFGDWIEHKITLEAIEAPEQEVTYPRVVAQNKPRYRYCRHCKANGKKSVATWICIECSNNEQQDVLVCEACLDEYHPEHFADEILY